MQIVTSDKALEAEGWAAKREGVAAWVKFAQVVALLLKNGKHTQESLAVLYDEDRSTIAQAARVGVDQRIVAACNNLPKSQRTVYELTTLDDAGFQDLAKPDTTVAKIQEYKRRISPTPPPPLVPPKTRPIERPTAEEVREAFKTQESKEIKPSYPKDLSWAFATFGIQGTPKISMESLDAIYRVLTAKRHPDRSGGNSDAMADLNTARLLIAGSNIWVR